MADITWTNDRRKLSDLIPWERNPRQIKAPNVKRLQESLAEFGQVEPVAIGPDGELYNGHQRLKSWLVEFGDIEIDVRIASRPLTEKEREKLTVFLHKGATGEFDFDILANEFEVGELLEWGFNEFELGIGVDDGQEGGPTEEEQPGLSAADVPDAVWPTNNEWGIPLLDANLQADAVDLPFSCWGAVSRKAQMRGTWHFYTQDYRYEALWKDPTNILNTGALTVVEPNFSCYEQMPRAVGLWQIYRKRWITRYWQSFGLRALVDLNVAEPFYDLNLLGVPAGWRAWATRGYTERMHMTEREYEIACKHAGTSSILFVVYGGGRQVREMCLSNGWIWFDEEMSRGRFEQEDE